MGSSKVWGASGELSATATSRAFICCLATYMTMCVIGFQLNWEIESIYLHQISPLFEHGLDRAEHCYGGYALASFSSFVMSAIGVDSTEFPFWRFPFLAGEFLWEIWWRVFPQILGFFPGFQTPQNIHAQLQEHILGHSKSSPKAPQTEMKADSPKTPFGLPFPRSTPSPLLWHVLFKFQHFWHQERQICREISPKFSCRKFFWDPLDSWTSAPSGQGCLRKNLDFPAIRAMGWKFLGRCRLLFHSWLARFSARPPGHCCKFWSRGTIWVRESELERIADTFGAPQCQKHSLGHSKPRAQKHCKSIGALLRTGPWALL